MIFILTQRENLGLKTEINRSDVLELTTKDGKKKKTLTFDKIGKTDQPSWLNSALGNETYQ